MMEETRATRGGVVSLLRVTLKELWSITAIISLLRPTTTARLEGQPRYWWCRGEKSDANHRATAPNAFVNCDSLSPTPPPLPAFPPTLARLLVSSTRLCSRTRVSHASVVPQDSGASSGGTDEMSSATTRHLVYVRHRIWHAQGVFPNCSGPSTWYRHIGCGICCTSPHPKHSNRSEKRLPYTHASHTERSSTTSFIC